MKVSKIVALLIYLVVSLLIYWNWTVILPGSIFQYFSYDHLILQYRLGPSIFSFIFNIFYPFNIGGMLSFLFGLPPYYAIIVIYWAFTLIGGFSMYLFLAKLIYLLKSSDMHINHLLVEGSSIVGGLTYMLLPYSLNGDAWTFGARMLFPLFFYILLNSLKDDRWFFLLAGLTLWAGTFYIDPRFGMYAFIFSIFIIFIPFYVFSLIERRILIRKFILLVGIHLSILFVIVAAAYFARYFWQGLAIPAEPSGQSTDLIDIMRFFSPSILEGFSDGFTSPYKWSIAVALFPLLFTVSAILVRDKDSAHWKFLAYILALFSTICGLFLGFPYIDIPLINYFFLFLVEHNIITSILVVLFQFGRFVYSAITLLLAIGVGTALLIIGNRTRRISHKAILSATLIPLIVSMPVLGNYYQSPGPFIPNNVSASLEYMKLYSLLGSSFPYNSLIIPPYPEADVYTYNSPYHERDETLYYYYYSYIIYLLNKGDISQAVRLLNMWGIRYLIVDSNLLPRGGIPLHFSFTGGQLHDKLLSSGCRFVGNIGTLSIYNISEVDHPFYISAHPLYVLGSLSDYGSLTNFLHSKGISVMPTPIFYDGPLVLSQPSLPLNLSFPLLVSPTYTWHDLAVSLALKNSIIVVPSHFLRGYKYWAAGFNTDPPQGLFITFMAYGKPNYKWNYGYLPQYGYTFTQPESQPLSMSTNIQRAGRYLVAVNVLRSPDSGLLTVSISDRNFLLDTKSDFNATYFSWMVAGQVELNSGNVPLTLHAQGFVAVNVIALIPQSEFETALSEAESYVSSAKLIYLIPSIELPANHSLTFVPPSTGKYYLYTYPSNSTNAFIATSASTMQANATSSPLWLVGGSSYVLSINSNSKGIVIISNFDLLDYFRDTKIVVNRSGGTYEIRANSNYLVLSSNNLYPTAETLRIYSRSEVYNIPVLNIFNGYVIHFNDNQTRLIYAYSSLPTPVFQYAVPVGIVSLLVAFCYVQLKRRRISDIANTL